MGHQQSEIHVPLESKFDGLDISVEAERGKVRLSRKVFKREAKQLAVTKASNIC